MHVEGSMYCGQLSNCSVFSVAELSWLTHEPAGIIAPGVPQDDKRSPAAIASAERDTPRSKVRRPNRVPGRSPALPQSLLPSRPPDTVR